MIKILIKVNHNKIKVIFNNNQFNIIKKIKNFLIIRYNSNRKNRQIFNKIKYLNNKKTLSKVMKIISFHNAIK